MESAIFLAVVILVTLFSAPLGYARVAIRSDAASGRR